jgi:hypothetical protein
MAKLKDFKLTFLSIFLERLMMIDYEKLKLAEDLLQKYMRAVLQELVISINPSI